MLRAFYLTSRGRLRPRNEDALLLREKIIGGVSMEEPLSEEFEKREGIFAVADGLGGHACGEIASRLALESPKGSAGKNPRDLVLGAKEYLDRYVEEHPRCYGMGTTLAGIIFSEEKATVFNVGDCRVYRYRDSLELLTKDHTSVFYLYEEGIIDYETLRNHPERNFLESALLGGVPEAPQLFSREVSAEKGDRFLLCSDGLWETLSWDELGSILGKETGEAAELLFRIAYERSRDNLSFILLSVES